MKGVFVLVLVVAGCASVSAPAPKEPDESRRVPVNRVVPPEAGAVPGSGRPAKRGKVEWR